MDIAVIVFTVALVVTTAAYAYFTWQMVHEMRAARREMQASRAAAIMPRLVLTMEAPDADGLGDSSF